MLPTVQAMLAVDKVDDVVAKIKSLF
jgi:hypothetical protein